MNNKGFVLTETLVVTVFLVTIFTFVYVSIIPLMGDYDDLSYRMSDDDIVYKLYHIRKMINADSHKNTIVSGTFSAITCSGLDNPTECNKLMDYLELRSNNTDNYILIFASSVSARLQNFANYTPDTQREMYNYLRKHEDFEGKVLVLLDKKKHTIAHLAIY
jgi:hypothetical protein